MDRLGLTVRTAGPADVDAIVGLLDLAYDTTGAGLGQRFTPGQVARYVAGSACALAVSDGRALGVLVTQPVPAGDEDGPITRAMVDAFPPPAGCYVYGPIAVDPAARGSGVGPVDGQLGPCGVCRPNRLSVRGRPEHRLTTSA